MKALEDLKDILKWIDVTFDEEGNANLDNDLETNVVGLYFIRTKYTLEELRRIDQIQHKRHYNFKERIEFNSVLEEQKYTCQKEEGYRIIYTGSDLNIKNRISAHFNSHKVGCLAINSHKELTENNKWQYSYIKLTDHSEFNSLDNDKKIRLKDHLELLWRLRNGWPILCKK